MAGIPVGGAGAAEQSEFLVKEGAPPLPPDATPEQKEIYWYQHVYRGDQPQLTFRAVAMGAILGMLMAASNLYTTLKVGWGFGVAITACVMSYVIWNGFRAATRGRLRQMTILENTCMASCASAAGYSTGSTMATMFGALLILESERLNINLKTWDAQAWWKLGGFTLLTALVGVFLAIPMKRQMINREQLKFPSGTAAAVTLRALYSQGREAMQKAWALVIGILAGALVGFFNTGEGVIKAIDGFFNFTKRLTGGTPLRLPELMPEEGFLRVTAAGGLTGAKTLKDSVFQLPGFGFEPSALLIAAGMITGLRVSLSMIFGSLLLYLWVGPAMVNLDTVKEAASAAAIAADPSAHAYVRGVAIRGGGTVMQIVHWALWGGTATMVFSSLTAVALQWPTIARSFKFGSKKADSAATLGRGIEVPNLWLAVGIIPVGLAMVTLLNYAFGIPVWMGLIALGMSYVLSLVASRATGETDTTPIGAMGKVMQLIFAVLRPGQITPNLAAAGTAANSAIGSADLLTDLKSGYLLGANPRKQFWAQFIGCFFGTLAIVPFWYLMIPDHDAIEKYPLPATQQWVAVTKVLTKGWDSLADSAKMAIVIGAAVGVLMPVIERMSPAKMRRYLPSVMGLGLSWVVPFQNSFAFAIGAVLVLFWEQIHKKSSDKFAIPTAAGLIAGESLLKAIIAMSATAIGLLSG